MKAKTAAAMILASTLAVMPIGGGPVCMASGEGVEIYYYGRSTADSTEGGNESENSDNDAGRRRYHQTDPIDWSAQIESINLAIQSPDIQNLDFQTADSFVVPASILNHIAGKDVTLAIHVKSDLTFSVSGRNIGLAQAALAIDLIPSGIPEYRKQEILAGACAGYLFQVKDTSAYPVPVNVHVGLGAENAGKIAMFYSYVPADASLRLMGSFQVTESGQAMFPLKHGGEYVILMADKVTGYTVKSGEHLSLIASRHQVSLKELIAVNPQIANPDQIDAGQRINVPVR